MSGFEVHADSLDGYATQVARVKTSADKGLAYFDDYCNFRISDGQGVLFSMFDTSHVHVVRSVRGILNRVAEISIGSQKGLHAAANYYRQTDRTTAEKADAIYNHSVRPTPPSDGAAGDPYAGVNSGPGTFLDIEDPTTQLREPDEGYESPMKAIIQDPGSILDYFSPSKAVFQAVELVTGANVVQNMSDWFAGDWEAYHKCGSALENLASMLNSVATNIQSGANRLGQAWTGNASDAASNYFYNLSCAIGDQQTGLVVVGEQYKKVAEGVWRAADQCSDLIYDMLDEAIVGGAAAYAGGVLAETGVGLAAGGLVAAIEAEEILKKYNKFVQLQKLVWAFCNSAVAFAQSGMQFTTMLDQYPLPDNGYQYPPAK